MKHLICKIIPSFLFSTFLFFLSGCGNDDFILTQEHIEKSYAIEYLKKEIYYFPAKQESNDTLVYQPLHPFDFIFVGHDFNSSDALLAYATPGHFTHMLMYLGKDDAGFAYGVEMNGEPEDSYHIDMHGLNLDGRLYVYCLGNDYGEKECPRDLYHHGLETYDYMWAKRLEPSLHEQLLSHQEEIITTIKQDLINAYPTQLPFYIGWDTPLTKVLPLIDDGRFNGADCTAYFISLLEEKAKICLNDVRIDAAELEYYFIYDPIGQQATIPAQYNPFSKEDLPMSFLFTQMGYSITDISRQTECSNHKTVTGIPIPDKVFHSLDLTEIEPVSFTTARPSLFL